MSLKKMFLEPVDRHIEGVIKADDDTHLKLELKEYVLTNEVAKRLESFLDAYRNYEGANGVWISGFFGSGKSHLLKILSLVLENRAVDGVPALELFLPKCRENAFLKGELQKAVSIPSKSILFNIDQKADVISKAQIDALLAVFVKVFDETCGYYGKQGHIAQFERDLDSRGQYDEFKNAYREISGKEWEFGREQALLEGQNIADAYAKIAGVEKQAAMGILDKYRKDYKVSIEDFANQVNAYMESKGDDFRLNFFVDEVGQYIADNIKLMTNLQTIAESLATKCRGRAWIIVTAQEDMNTVIGEVNKRQSEDFSKIQDRFANRMKLTSADVAEVIQKRLLAKNEDGAKFTKKVFDKQVNNFKTLFDFGDGSKSYRNFQDEDHFRDCYPFIPYQFVLFQAAIQNLSAHNAFEGRHSSVGERSMLGVFQQVAITVADRESGQLATFDLMFEGIRAALKGNIQRSVLVAEKNLDHPFAVQVLKALFLVKYVKEFKATARNISVLMLDRFDRDLPEFTRQVREALDLLEQQTYIQRNGGQYEFLTDEEKDIEQEIKHTDVETAAVSDELSKIIFDTIIRNRKIRHEESGRDYPFSRKLDDRLIGREYELSIHVISPFHDDAGNKETLRMRSWGQDELLVVMPPDARLMQDMLMYKRTEKYVRQNITITQQETIRRILTDKNFQNQDRLKEIKKSVHDLLGRADIYLSGDEIEIGEKDPQLRIVQAFSSLVLKVYTNLRMLSGITYSEEDIKKTLKDTQGSLFGDDATLLSEPEQEMQGFIQGKRREGMRTTIKSLTDRFERKPYGWDLAAVLCVLAKLCARGKIEAKQDSDILEDDDLVKALRNTHGHNNVVLEPQIDFTASQIRRLKTFYEDFFDSPPKGKEARDLGKETAEAFNGLIDDLDALSRGSEPFPFIEELKTATEQIRKQAGKSYTHYLAELSGFEEPLLDLKEALLDPIRRFMTGPNRSLFLDAARYLRDHEPNLPYVSGDHVDKIREILNEPACYKGNKMQRVRSLMDELKAGIEEQLGEIRKQALERIAGLRDDFMGMDEFAQLKEDQKAEIKRVFETRQGEIERQRLIAVIRDILRRFEDEEYSRLLEKLDKWIKDEEEGRGYGSPEPSPKGEISDTPTSVVTARSIRVSFGKPWLVDESDVEQYLKMVREALLAEIRTGKRIQI